MSVAQSSRYPDGLVVVFDDAHWIADTLDRLRQLSPDTPVQLWHAHCTPVDLEAEPPAALFFAFCSASARQREAPHSFEAVEHLLAWLRLKGRRVVNGDVMKMEGSKAEQIRMCRRVGLPVPRTVVAGTTQLKHLSNHVPEPFIFKPDRGGSGDGVKAYQTLQELQNDRQHLREHVSPTGVYIFQEFLDRDRGFFRAEFVGGRFLYLARIIPNPDSPTFNMCPCAHHVDNFQLTQEFTHPIRARMEEFIQLFNAENVAFEFILDAEGDAYVIDINSNTSYNVEAEQHYKMPGGFDAVAKYLAELLHAV